MKLWIRTIIPISSIVSSSTSRGALRALFHTSFLPLLVSRECLIFHDEALERSRIKDVIRQKECNRRRRLVSNPRLHPSYEASINPQDHGVLAFAKIVVVVRSFTRHEKKVQTNSKCHLKYCLINGLSTIWENSLRLLWDQTEN